MDDRRQHSRHTAQLNIEALDLHSGRRLGRVVDLSEDGFMLISETPPEADSVWECRLCWISPWTAFTNSASAPTDCGDAPASRATAAGVASPSSISPTTRSAPWPCCCATCRPE